MMKPINQKNFTTLHGDCFRCCVASIFEDETVPNFMKPDPEAYYDRLIEWADEKGYAVMNIRLDSIDDGIRKTLKNCYLIACGESSGGDIGHAVVWLNGQMVHDPHPAKSGLKDKPESFTIFIAKNPANKKESKP